MLLTLPFSYSSTFFFPFPFKLIRWNLTHSAACSWLKSSAILYCQCNRRRVGAFWPYLEGRSEVRQWQPNNLKKAYYKSLIIIGGGGDVSLKPCCCKDSQSPRRVCFQSQIWQLFRPWIFNERMDAVIYIRFHGTFLLKNNKRIRHLSRITKLKQIDRKELSTISFIQIQR